MHITSPTADLTYKAAGIERVVESPEALLIYISPVQAVILPKRHLSEEDYRQAVALARQYVVPQPASPAVAGA